MRSSPCAARRAEVRCASLLLSPAPWEPDPRRKCAALEEALDLLNDASEAGDTLSQSDQSLARNLRRSNTRRLLSQLAAMGNVHFDVGFGYLFLLFFRLGREVDALLEEDESLRTAYDAFTELWASEAAEALRNILARSKEGR